MTHEYGTRKATRKKRAKTEEVEAAPQEVVAVEEAAAPSPDFHLYSPVVLPQVPELNLELLTPDLAPRRGLFATPQATDGMQTPSTPKILKGLPKPIFTPIGNVATSPWAPIVSPGLDEFLGRDALRQPAFTDASPLPNSPPSAFFTRARAAQPQPDAYATASEMLLNYIRETLTNEKIDTAEMLRIVTSAHTSVSEALKTLPESSAKLAELYQEFIGKLGSFIGLINHRQQQAEALTSDDLGFFLSTLSAPQTSIKVGNH